MISILDYLFSLFLFLIANPLGLVLFIAGLVYAEYVIGKSIAKDRNHIKLVNYVAQSANRIKAIRVPIREVTHKIKKRKLSQI